METTFQQPEAIDHTKVYTGLTSIREKINQLPSEARKDLFLECNLLEDFFKDKYLRSLFRQRKVLNKKIGGSFFLVD
jgi:hypothetical protein